MTRLHFADRRFLYPALMVIALISRAIYFLGYRDSAFYDVFRNDQLYYRTWGLQIASADPLGNHVFAQGPLYAYILGVLFRFTSHLPTVLILQLLTGCATVALVTWCADRLWGGRSAWIAGLLAAIYGPFVFYECMIMKTFLEPLIVMAALAAGLGGLATGRIRWFAAAGGAVGLACLVRESHALLLAPLLAAAWMARAALEPARRRRILRAGSALGAFCLAIAPATLHNWSARQEFVAVTTGGGQNFFIGFWFGANGYYTAPLFDSRLPFREHEDYRLEASFREGRRLTHGESSRYWFREGVRAIRTAPQRALNLLGVKALILFNNHERPDNENYLAACAEVPALRFLPTFGWTVGLGFIGLLVAIRAGGASWLPAGFAACLVLEVLLSFNLGRYRIGLAAIWILFAGHGLAWLGTQFIQTKRTGLGSWSALLVILALTAFAFRTPPRLTRAFIAGEEDRFLTEARAVAEVRDRIAPLRQALMNGSAEDPQLLAQLALALDATGKINESLPIFDRTLRADPRATAPRYRLAEIFSFLGDLDGAIGQARILARQVPYDPAVNVLLARLLILRSLHDTDDGSAQRLLEEAVGQVQRALSLDPAQPQALVWVKRLSRLPQRE